MPTTTASDAGQSASASAHASTSSQSDSDTATLYLFTFLATILILVLLSVSLVLRSYILRRRYRRRFQRALSDTLFLNADPNGAGPFDPLGFPRSSRRLGPKPVLWDIWTHPANNGTWSSLTIIGLAFLDDSSQPVAVRCIPSSLPSALIPLPQSSTTPHATLSSPPSPSALLAQLRRTPSLSLASSPSSSLQARTLARPPILSRGRSRPPSAVTPSRPGTHAEKDTTTLAVCVLVAMPDASALVHCPVPDAKGKRVVQVPCQSGDADPPLSSSLHRAGTCTPHFGSDEEGPPLLEFGVAEVKMRDWAWSSAGT